MSSGVVSVPVEGSAQEKAVRARCLQIGAIAWVAAAALAVYAAYGDQHPKANQESGVPSVVIAGLLAAVVVFGLLVPRSLRACRSGRAYGVVSLVLVPIAFWSGVPMIVGAAAVTLGRRDHTASKASRVAVVTGAVAIGLTVLITVLGNTLLAR